MVDVIELRAEGRRDALGIDEPRPRLSWRLAAERRGARQVAAQVQVASRPDFAPRSLCWDTGPVPGHEVRVVYGGPTIPARTRAWWRVRVTDEQARVSRWSETAWWEVGLPSATDWSGRFVTFREPDLISEPAEMWGHRPGPLVRHRFRLPGPVARARAYATALGLYQLRINGTVVGERLLMPGWTDYRSRIEYQAYDVTDRLRAGENVIGASLADGWWAGMIAWFGRCQYGEVPALLAQLEVELQDGTRVVIATDADWEGRPGPSTVADLIVGERIDGRREPVGWDSPGVETAGWSPVQLQAPPGVPLVAARDDGVRRVETFSPRSMDEREPGRTIVDFGQNLTGTVTLAASAPAGTVATLRFAEVLDESGELYTANLRSAEVTDAYTFRGDGMERFDPAFTFHGFRYAEVSGLPGTLRSEDLQARAISSATVVGDFDCSDADVSAVHRNALWSLLDNFVSVPTDCPQRDERLAWSGDIGVFAPTALLMADVVPFLEKWLVDLTDAQEPSGAYRDFAPVLPRAGAGNSAWADAGVLLPWAVFQHTGDAAVLDRQYPSMRRFLAYLEGDHTGGIRRAGRYGDWVSLGERTSKELIGTAYLARSAGVFRAIARLLGHEADAERFGRLEDLALDAYRHAFVTEDGDVIGGTQTGYALTLGFELAPDGMRRALADRLAASVRANGLHLTTGFVGTPLLLPALSDHGHHEVACELMRQPDAPGWVFEVRHGATTIWERWTGWSPETGFADPRMNSFNHYAFGSVGAWMYRSLAGIAAAEPGYRRVVVRPRPAAGFTWARASTVSPHGRHAVAWEAVDGRLVVRVDVPVGTVADVAIPDGSRTLTVDGVPVTADALVSLGSGSHVVSWTQPAA